MADMSIEVKFFASLREQVGMESTTVNLEKPASLREVWNQSTGNAKLPTNLLCAVNMEYTQLDDPVNDGDEVAFFPPVTGG